MGETEEVSRTSKKTMRTGLSLCVGTPEILLPATGIDRTKWPVIACDQYTSQPDYWESIAREVADFPSSFHIILPEAYLENPGPIGLVERIASINLHMEQYLSEGILMSIGECMVLVDRQTPVASSRKGLVLEVDLEKYDYEPGADNLIRATEGTVLERIPPRMRIRRDAPLEIPHIQLLVDDPERTIIEPLAKQCEDGRYEILYDQELMAGGGHIRGYRIPKDAIRENRMSDALSALSSYKEHGLLFAVGDGNHSLATAKAHWNSIKAAVSPTHPARYALVELINIHDEGLVFEPIHRVLFHADLDDFISKSCCLVPEMDLLISERMSVENAILMAQTIDPQVQPIPVFQDNSAVVFTFSKTPSKLAVGSMQLLIDAYLAGNPEARVDYIHGEEAVMALSADHIGMLFPAISKDTFFETIVNEGVLPRKTFSMGESFEKRYYMECKLIVQ